MLMLALWSLLLSNKEQPQTPRKVPRKTSPSRTFIISRPPKAKAKARAKLHPMIGRLELSANAWEAISVYGCILCNL
jgi:hypothetical protein